MPKYDRFLIGPMVSGQQNNLKPYAIPDDAYELIKNAYVFRGRLRKRFGARVLTPNAASPQLNTRLGIVIGTTDGSGNLAPTGITDLVVADIVAGQAISVGTDIFHVLTPGSPTSVLVQDPAAGTVNLDDVAGTIEVVGGAANAEVKYYLGFPVMGFIPYENPEINQELTFAFDTNFVYRFVNNQWERFGTGAAATWSGDDAEFFWGANYQGDTADTRVLYVTNFNTTDGIRYWNGTAWTLLYPLYVTALHINTCRLIIPFKNRLIFLNTVEEVSAGPPIVSRSFPQRARWSQSVNLNTITGSGPTTTNAWRQDQGLGKGFFADASTTEAIITASILKDRLIVFFERSTWELVYTQNQDFPFTWQKINTELGAESTFSVVPFDKVILGVGNVGIQACNGANVERIDQLIPQEVFKIHNQNSGPERVAGIRDYTNEMVYWTFPSLDNNGGDVVYPQRVLVYNYATGAWAINDDSITAFGYFQPVDNLTWADITWTWEEWISSWGSGALQADFRSIIAGNQQGYTFLLDAEELTRNSLSLSITDIGLVGGGPFTIYEHNLQSGDFVFVDNILGTADYTALNGNIYEVVYNNIDQVSLVGVGPFVGSYYGSGTLERVSRIDALTKQYNFYAKDGDNIALYKADMMVDRTVNGEFCVDYLASSSSASLVQAGMVTGAAIGNNVLQTSPYTSIPFEATQDRLWHPVYFQGEGEVIQMRFYLNDEQLSDPDIVFSNFVLHQFVCYVQRVSRLQ